MPKFQHLVVDTAAFVKNVQLQNIAENCYTVPGVLGEIRSNRQMKALAVLPYDLKVRDPDPDVLGKVIAVAKKTGDFASLSLVDLQVIALTYELEAKHVGLDHLRDKPRPALLVSAAKKPAALEGTELLKGFYVSKRSNKQNSASDELEEADESEDIPGEVVPAPVDSPAVLSGTEDSEKESKEAFVSEEAEESGDEYAEEDHNSDEAEEESDDDDGGWITPSNIVQVKRDIGMNLHEEVEARVACITTDYALQNVLKQIGLQIAALDGRIIKQARTYILRCYACFKTTPDATKVFCPKCGNRTLKKVAVSLDADGQQIIHINSRRPLTAKYKNKPVAKFEGGKYATNPVLFEDQPLPQQRISVKARAKTNALGDDYIAGYSPFVMRDVDSRSAVLRGSADIKQRMTNLQYDNKRRGYWK
ncbi:RNA-binding protein NOB1 [Anopheles nili]|uniref:RNA-binding protein NOB1 n=1 Tax=Anopheles nili TaxID=185578 RepID=UPI00237BC314|nr:RNA-binding protein NOB1 [Anopheles nili]